MIKFHKYAVAYMSADKEVEIGALGVSRGYRGHAAQPHRAVLCHTIIDHSQLDKPMLMRADCYKFFAESPYDMDFTEFVKALWAMVC
ncbi:MAG: hypothetical protein ABJJ69_15865 [Paracoccaceae bacterium]